MKTGTLGTWVILSLMRGAGPLSTSLILRSLLVEKIVLSGAVLWYVHCSFCVVYMCKYVITVPEILLPL